MERRHDVTTGRLWHLLRSKSCAVGRGRASLCTVIALLCLVVYALLSHRKALRTIIRQSKILRQRKLRPPWITECRSAIGVSIVIILLW
jgi:hypothetical protein